MKKSFIIICIIVLIVILGYGAYRYFYPEDTVVNEELPKKITKEQNTSKTTPQSSTSQNNTTEEEKISQSVTVQNPFQQGDSSYNISGKAVLSKQEDKSSLSFVDFSVTAGPSLFVYLVNTEDTSNQGVKQAIDDGKFVSIAELKGNKGNQTYQIPSDVNLEAYNVVSIWCKPFERNFGYAILE